MDACVRNVRWNSSNERIQFDMYWEDGKYVVVSDFGRFDRYATREDRRRVFDYLKPYDGLVSRPRMILTLKGDETNWTLASATMLKRIATLNGAR